MEWRRARSWFTAALGVTLSFSALGRASEPTAEERVDKLRDQAFAAASAGRYTEAADRFREAWELGNDFFDICNLGRAKMDLGRWREAAEHLAICLKVMPEDQKPTFGERFERFQKEVRAKVGVLSITANVQGAEVFVDDKLVGKLPLDGPIFVDPGSHKVQVTAPGFHPDTKLVEAKAGSLLHLDVRLSETKPEVVPASTPEAAPAQKRAAGSSSREQPASAPKESVKEPGGRGGAAAQGKAQPRTALLVTGSALGIVGAAVGIGGLIAADRAYDDAEAMDKAVKKTGPDVPCYAPENFVACKEQGDTRNKVTPLTALGIGGLALAGAGVALIIYEVVRASSDNAKGGPSAAVLVTPGGGFLGLTGTF